jgi:NodT family efflux transporter outer membrane factor (OMF) lipoprotein
MEMNSRLLFSTAAVSSLLLVGCCMLPSVGPDYKGPPEIEIPESAMPDAGLPTTNRFENGTFKSAEGKDDTRNIVSTNDLNKWWAKFNDDKLNKLVDTSVSNNLSYLMVRERLTASRWALMGAYAAFMPKLNLDASATRLQNGKYTSSRWDIGSKIHRDVFSAGFDARWEIDIFGGSRRDVEASAAKVEADEFRLADAWVSLTAEVGRQYIALRTVQARIDVARKNLLLQKETFEILKSRLDSGIGDELAVNQSKYVMDQTHAAIPPLLAEETKLLSSIAILTGEMPGSVDGLLKDHLERDWIVEPFKLEKTPLNAIRSRPDVRSAERDLAARVAYVGVAKAQWFPKLFINGSIGFDSIHPDTLFRKRALAGAIGPAISWPIFQGGDIYASVKIEEARMKEAMLNYELTLQKAYAEVRDAYAAYTQEYHRYLALEGAVKAAKDAVAISQNLYRNGLKDFTAVIDAQRSLLSLEESLVVSRGQITQNMIALFKALGGR